MQTHLTPQRRSTLAIAALTALVLAATGYYELSHAQTMTVSAAAGADAAPLPAGLPDMASIAARFGPAVVNISIVGTRKVSTAAEGGHGDEGDGAVDADAMREFLRGFQQRFGGLPPQLLTCPCAWAEWPGKGDSRCAAYAGRAPQWRKRA